MSQSMTRPSAIPAVTSWPGLTTTVETTPGGGSPLPATERAFFEPRFGRDLTNVRIHTGTAADQSAKSINARAYTLGSDIAFGRGEYSLGAPAGRRLMAHELAHTVQQTGTAGARTIRRKPTGTKRAKYPSPDFSN